MANRNLMQQAKYAIRNCESFGADKHSMKEETRTGKLVLPETHHIFSYKSRDALHDLSKQIMSFIKENHPDVKLIRDVKVEHMNEFLDSKKSTCSTATIKGYTSKIHKLQLCVNHTFRCNVDWSSKIVVPKSEVTPNGEKLRNQQMAPEDFKKIYAHATASGKTSLAPRAWELTRCVGLRVSGGQDIKAKNVHLDINGRWGYGQVDIVEKGKRHRKIDILCAEDRNIIEKWQWVKNLTSL